MEFLSRAQMILAVGAVGLALLVLDLVRRRKLSEEYSVLWIVSSVAIATLGFSTPVLKGLTQMMGILNESSLVLMLGVAFGMATVLYLSVRLSRLGREFQTAVREIALLRNELEALRPPRAGAGGEDAR